MARVAAGETIRTVARVLRISPSCVSKWSGRLRTAGSVSPDQVGGHKPRVLSGAHAHWLCRRMSSEPFTLRGLVAELAGRGVRVDYRAVWEFAHREALSCSFKKNHRSGGAEPAGHRAQAGALEGLSGPDRSQAPRLHR
jgi:putative transposase